MVTNRCAFEMDVLESLDNRNGSYVAISEQQLAEFDLTE